MERHQLIPADMCAHPRPAEREVYYKEAPGEPSSRARGAGGADE